MLKIGIPLLEISGSRSTLPAPCVRTGHLRTTRVSRGCRWTFVSYQGAVSMPSNAVKRPAGPRMSTERRWGITAAASSNPLRDGREMAPFRLRIHGLVIHGPKLRKKRKPTINDPVNRICANGSKTTFLSTKIMGSNSSA